MTAVGAVLLIAAAPESVDHTAATRAIARDFMHLQYDLHDLRAVKGKYYSPDFIQHNPEIANGVQGDQQFIDARQAREPNKFLPVTQWTNVVDHVLVEDKYIAIHHHLYTSPDDKGRVFFDIWRVENGRMVEHWDIIQPVNPAPRNGNTMWSDRVAPSPPRAGDPAPEVVIAAYLRIGLDENDPRRAAEAYIADDFVQHSPHIADGKAALIAYFAARAATPTPETRIHSVSHIIADGDLVAVTRHVMRAPGDRGTMYIDLFRVARGQIFEHWDVIQPVPATSVNGNSMW